MATRVKELESRDALLVKAAQEAQVALQTAQEARCQFQGDCVELEAQVVRQCSACT